jgi:hypothetical protein
MPPGVPLSPGSPNMAAWHMQNPPKDWPPSRWRGPPYQLIYSLRQGSNLRKLWKSLLTDKEERERRMDSRNKMCRVNEKGHK